MSPDTFVSYLDGVKKRGHDKWLAKCPAHDDSDPSLSIASSRSGKILVKCFAGCSALEVVESVGLKLEDLFPDAYEEEPMAFAKKEILQREREKKDDKYKAIWLAIAITKMQEGRPLTGKEKETYKEYSNYATRKGLKPMIQNILKEGIKKYLED